MRRNPINLISCVFLELIIVFMVSSCGKPSVVTPTSTLLPTITFTPQPTDTPLPTLTPVCISAVPSQLDVDRALAYTGGLFSAAGWEQSSNTLEGSVAVTWQNVSQNALVYLEAIVFPCSYEEPDLNKYYSDENWKVIFQSYDGYQLNVECKMDSGLRLYQFKAQSLGAEYEIRYWVQNDTETRVISTMIVFPVGPVSQMDDYALRLFPSLPNCS